MPKVVETLHGFSARMANDGLVSTTNAVDIVEAVYFICKNLQKLGWTLHYINVNVESNYADIDATHSSPYEDQHSIHVKKV